MINKLFPNWRQFVTILLLASVLLAGGWLVKRWYDQQLQNAILGKWYLIESEDKTGAVSRDPYGSTPYIFHPDGRLEIHHPFIAYNRITYRVLDNQHIEWLSSDARSATIMRAKITEDRMVLTRIDGSKRFFDRRWSCSPSLAGC